MKTIIKGHEIICTVEEFNELIPNIDRTSTEHIPRRKYTHRRRLGRPKGSKNTIKLTGNENKWLKVIKLIKKGNSKNYAIKKVFKQDKADTWQYRMIDDMLRKREKN